MGIVFTYLRINRITMKIRSNVPTGRPLALVDELAEIVKKKQALKGLEKTYKELIDLLKSKDKTVLSGNKNILYFKEVNRTTVDTDLLTSAEKSTFEQLKKKASVSTASLSFDKIIAK